MGHLWVCSSQLLRDKILLLGKLEVKFPTYDQTSNVQKSEKSWIVLKYRDFANFGLPQITK